MDLIQSYISVVGRYAANDYERRILMHIVKHAQADIQKKHLQRPSKTRQRPNANIPLQCSAKALMPDGSQHYDHVQKALLSLMKKVWQFYDSDTKTYYATPVLYNLTWKKGSGEITFYVAPRLYEAILDFSRGFCQYELCTASTLKHDASVRLYAIFSKTRVPLTYSITELRKIFSCETKYRLTADFLKRVIYPAVNELKTERLNGATATANRENGKIVSVTFTPAVREETNTQKLLPKLSVQSAAGGPLFLMLTRFYEFSTHELGPHKRLLADFANIPKHCDILSAIAGRSRTASNPKGYIIGAMKQEVINHKAAQSNDRPSPIR